MRGSPYNKLSLQELIELNEQEEFNWKNVFVCTSPNITLEFIEKYIDKPWDWSRLSVNPNLTQNLSQNTLTVIGILNPV
jgi:hypothetical protein